MKETKKKGPKSENLGFYDHFYNGIIKDKKAQQRVSILIHKSMKKCII